MIARRWVDIDEAARSDLGCWTESDTARNVDLVAQWEAAVADYVGLPHAAAVSSGRSGMTLIFEHLGLREGDEVIVPAYTLGQLLPLVQGFGAKAVPADIEPETLNVAPKAVEQRITPRTKALLTLHAFGAPCAVSEIADLADRHGIPLIEDCAHSLGASVAGRATGSFGHASFFSFEVAKPVNTFGGGMVVSRDRALIDAVHEKTAGLPCDLQLVRERLRANDREQRLFATGLAFPPLCLLATPVLRGFVNRLYYSMRRPPSRASRFSPLQAKFGLAGLATLDTRVRRRNERARLYRSLLKPEIRMQRVPDACVSSWYFLVAVLPCLAAPVRRRLLFRGIDAGIEEEIADDCAALLRYDDCPNVAETCPRAINLPLFDGISEATVERVAHALNALVSRDA